MNRAFLILTGMILMIISAHAQVDTTLAPNEFIKRLITLTSADDLGEGQFLCNHGEDILIINQELLSTAILNDKSSNVIFLNVELDREQPIYSAVIVNANEEGSNYRVLPYDVWQSLIYSFVSTLDIENAKDWNISLNESDLGKVLYDEYLLFKL